jgi:hypothetical protein
MRTRLPRMPGRTCLLRCHGIVARIRKEGTEALGSPTSMRAPADGQGGTSDPAAGAVQLVAAHSAARCHRDLS